MKRSFPLTEEEYILRLDDVANNLRCWGAVSHVRNSLEKSKERPRIGKLQDVIESCPFSNIRGKLGNRTILHLDFGIEENIEELLLCILHLLYCSRIAHELIQL
ncbi:hypothetical protein BUALT_Bualt05G0093600 [Buddleja alternifolia]|uniref:Uncharacterized protein n=1 Tax=Buddleja alternifolia TaxID=168488 RepID=A0AAV6XRA1_9LAMI|nr:hypothetical protein BUALT_Bualt05G0093600 [Buddleja alternifolia]